MIYQVYSSYDEIQEAWATPVCFPNEKVFNRSLEIAVKSADEAHQAIIKDSIFYQIGTFDDETGIFASLEQKKLIIKGGSLFNA